MSYTDIFKLEIHAVFVSILPAVDQTINTGADFFFDSLLPVAIFLYLII